MRESFQQQNLQWKEQGEVGGDGEMNGSVLLYGGVGCGKNAVYDILGVEKLVLQKKAHLRQLSFVQNSLHMGGQH